MEWGTWNYWISTLQLFYLEDQILFLLLPQPPLLICTLFQLTSCLETYHLDQKLININFFDVYWALSLIYVLKYFKAVCLAEFLLGFILPVPVCLRLPSSGFSLNNDEPWKSACFWPLHKTGAGYVGLVILGASWKFMYSPKCLLVYHQSLFYLLIFYGKCKTYKYFYCIILNSKSVGIIFVRYRKHMHLFKNLLLIYLVLAAYDSHICFSVCFLQYAFSSMFLYSATNYFWITKALCFMP